MNNNGGNQFPNPSNEGLEGWEAYYAEAFTVAYPAKAECTDCGTTITRFGEFDKALCDLCHERAHTCPECGTWIYDGEVCAYCYEIVDRYTVKVGRKVLYRGYDSDAADAAHAAALDRNEWRVRFSTEHNVTINRRDVNPYED